MQYRSNAIKGIRKETGRIRNVSNKKEGKEKRKQETIAQRIARMGILVALAMIFSYVEVLIPFSVGIPGVKLGIANLVVVTGVFLFPKKEVFLISLVRIILMGLLFGTGLSLIYSLTGGILSFLVMILGQRSGGLSVGGISILGAVSHNIGQLVAAMIILGNIRIGVYLPVLMVAGIITGCIIGNVSDQLMKRLKKLAIFRIYS